MDALEVKKKIKEFKHLPFRNYGISCVFNELEYKLYLLTAECEKDIRLMELLGRWRKENEAWFSAIFKITTEGTMKWFRDKLINEEDRLLFIIEAGNRFIGHIGLYRFKFDTMTCEIDNIIRGEACYKGIMQNAIEYMMDWGRKTLHIKEYTLQVCSTNERALRLYKNLGFAEVKREPVIRVEKEDRVELISVAKANKDEIVRYNIHMKQITR
jgi:RimJ/RimL family protein N-acetyltransferase